MEAPVQGIASENAGDPLSGAAGRFVAMS